MKLIPKYQQGKRIIGGYNKEGTMVLPVTNDKGINNVTLPEVSITPKNNTNLSSYIDKGKRRFLNTTKELLTPAVAGAGTVGLGVGMWSTPLLTTSSLATGLGGSYVGGKVGERIDKRTDNNSNYKQLGELLGGTLTGIGTAFTPRAIAGDTYTTVGGKFGYYGNPVQRVTGTLGRRYNWNTKARNPELLRKLEEPIKVNSNKTLQITNPNPRFSETITNFTTDRPVVPHSWSWDMNDLYIFNPKITKGMKPVSIEPSDTFYSNANITAKPSQTTLVSGNPLRLTDAKSKGISTLSSPEARRLHTEAEWNYLRDLRNWKGKIKTSTGAARRRLEKEEPMRNTYGAEYAKEIQRLQSNRGTPTIKDYNKLEDDTGLKAGVTDIKDMNPEKFTNVMESKGIFEYPSRNVIYPNRNAERKLLDKAKYNKVFYDPTTWAEENYRIKNVKKLW